MATITLKLKGSIANLINIFTDSSKKEAFLEELGRKVGQGVMPIVKSTVDKDFAYRNVQVGQTWSSSVAVQPDKVVVVIKNSSGYVDYLDRQAQVLLPTLQQKKQKKLGKARLNALNLEQLSPVRLPSGTLVYRYIKQGALSHGKQEYQKALKAGIEKGVELYKTSGQFDKAWEELVGR